MKSAEGTDEARRKISLKGSKMEMLNKPSGLFDISKELMQMYLVFFGIGVGFVILTLVIGRVMEAEVASLSFLRPSLVAVFLTVTGGLGLILTPRFYGTAGTVVVFIISAISGFLIATAINNFVIKPLHRLEGTNTYNRQEVVGQLAEVTAKIPHGGGYGKIKYNIEGSIVTGPAKCEDESELNIGEHAEITRVEGKTYYVKKR